MTNTATHTAAETLTIERELRIAATPETILPFLTDADKIVEWMAHHATIDARPGGMIRLDYNGFDIMRGEFVEVSPRRVVFTWGFETEGAPLAAGASRVEFTLTPDGAGTVLRMVHSGLPAGDGSHAEGWDHFLPRLATLAGGGDPGKDEWSPRKTELLAGQVNQGLKELRALVESCPIGRWNDTKTGEGWTIAATANHVMSHLGAIGLACAVGAGNPPEMNLTIEMVHAGNAQAAADSAGMSKDAVLKQISETGAAMVQALRDMPDEQLGNSFGVVRRRRNGFLILILYG